MPRIDLDILNQKQTPAFYASSLATRPAPSFVGRIFIDSDSPSTGLYRDTGTAWVSIADPGAGTTGTLQQVTTNGSSTNVGISVTTNGIGIGTAIPGANILDVHGTTGVLAQLENTTTQNSLLSFRNQGAGAWSIGNGYNAGANDFIIYDATSFLNRFSITNTGIASIIGLLNISSRLNVNGASDSSYSLNVTGQGNFSSGLSIATNTVLISSTSSAPSPFNPSGVIYSSTGYGTLIGCDNQFSSKYFGISTAGNFIHVGGSATFNGTLSANGLYTTSGNGIISGGNSYYISPSSTRGVVALQGSTDNFLTFGTKGYIGVGATYMQILAQTGVALSFVSDAATVLSFALSTGVGTFTNPIAIGNSVAAGVAVASTHKVSILIGGVQYYLLASNV
jgi:hypothetical protein